MMGVGENEVTWVVWPVADTIAPGLDPCLLWCPVFVNMTSLSTTHRRHELLACRAPEYLVLYRSFLHPSKSGVELPPAVPHVVRMDYRKAILGASKARHRGRCPRVSDPHCQHELPAAR